MKTHALYIDSSASTMNLIGHFMAASQPWFDANLPVYLVGDDKVQLITAPIDIKDYGIFGGFQPDPFLEHVDRHYGSRRPMSSGPLPTAFFTDALDEMLHYSSLHTVASWPSRMDIYDFDGHTPLDEIVPFNINPHRSVTERATSHPDTYDRLVGLFPQAQEATMPRDTFAAKAGPGYPGQDKPKPALPPANHQPFHLDIIDGYVGHDVAAATVRLIRHNGGDSIVGDLICEGSAKRHEGDPSDPVIGSNLALGRALSELGGILQYDALRRSQPPTLTVEFTSASVQELGESGELVGEPMTFAPGVTRNRQLQTENNALRRRNESASRHIQRLQAQVKQLQLRTAVENVAGSCLPDPGRVDAMLDDVRDSLKAAPAFDKMPERQREANVLLAKLHRIESEPGLTATQSRRGKRLEQAVLVKICRFTPAEATEHLSLQNRPVAKVKPTVTHPSKQAPAKKATKRS